MYKLPVSETILDGYRYIWAERSAWFDYMLGPVVAISVIPLVLLRVFFGTFQMGDLLGPEGQPAEGVTPAGVAGAALMIWVVLLFLYVVFAVAWHRRVLLGSEQTSARELFTWNSRHWQFAGRFIMLGFLAALASFAIGFAVSFPFGFAAGFGGTASGGAAVPAGGLAAVFMSWIATMLLTFALFVGPLLTLPALCVDDREFDISAGWKISNGNRWRMVAIYLFGAILPVFIAQIVLIAILGSGLSSLEPDSLDRVQQSFSAGLIIGLVSNALYFLGIAMGVTLLSIIYRRLRDNVDIASNNQTSA